MKIIFFCINIACINIAFYRPIAITVQNIIFSGYALFSWHMSCYLLSWSKYTTHCILIDCPDAPFNSSTTDLDTSTAQRYYFIGDNITYRCNSNHSLVSGNLTRNCLGNGTWSGQQPVCRSEKEFLSKIYKKKSNKSAGSDGFFTEFFKGFIWSILVFMF